MSKQRHSRATKRPRVRTREGRGRCACENHFINPSRLRTLFLLRRTILLSVISLLNEPNTYSPANVDASVMYRRWRDSKGRDKEYENIIR